MPLPLAQPSILSRISGLVPDYKPFATPAPGGGATRRRPTPDTEEKIPVRATGSLDRIWFLPYADSTATDDSPDIRDAMRSMIKDPYVKSAWFSQVLSVLAQPFQVHPPKKMRKNPEAQEQADFIRHCLENAHGGMLDVGTSILTNLGSDGFSLAEKVWQIEPRGKYANRLTLQALKPKDIDEHGRLIGDRFNNVVGVWSNQASLTYPITDFVYCRYMHLFDEPCGMAAFRPSYGSYWSRDTVRKLRIIHKEKMLDGLLVGYYTDPADKPTLEAALARARSSTWLSIPEGVRIDQLAKSQASESDYKSFDESLREETLVGIALAHLHILQGGVSDARGNTAVHKSIADLGPWLLTYIVQYALNRQVIPDLIDYNYPFTSEYPTVSLGGLENAEILEMLQVLDGAQRAGFNPSRNYYATELTIQEADPTDPTDTLAPPQQAMGGMGLPGGGMGGGDPFGGMGGDMGGGADPLAPPEPPAPGGGGGFGGFGERACSRWLPRNEFTVFGWDDWKQVQGGKWVSASGKRTLSDPVYRRLSQRATASKPSGPTTVRAPQRPQLEGGTAGHKHATETAGQQGERLVRMMSGSIRRTPGELRQAAAGIESWPSEVLNQVHHALFGGETVEHPVTGRKVPKPVPKGQAIARIRERIGGSQRPAEVAGRQGGYTLTNREYATLKLRLSRALKKGDPSAVMAAVIDAEAVFEEKGFPDDWSRWRRAADDVKMKQAHQGGWPKITLPASPPPPAATSPASPTKKVPLDQPAWQWEGVIGRLDSPEMPGIHYEVQVKKGGRREAGASYPVQIRQIPPGGKPGAWSTLTWVGPSSPASVVADALKGAGLNINTSFTFAGHDKPAFTTKKPSEERAAAPPAKPTPPPPPAEKAAAPFRPLESSGVKVPNVSVSSLYAMAKKSSTRFGGVVDMAADDGIWTDMKAMIVLDPTEQAKFKAMRDKSGEEKGYRKPPVAAVLDSAKAKTGNSPPAKVLGFRPPTEDNGKTPQVLLEHPDGGRQVIDAKYYAMLTKRFPAAEFRLAGKGKKGKWNDDAVGVWDKGNLVGVVMPMGEIGEEKYEVQAFSEFGLTYGRYGTIEVFGWDDWNQRGQHMVSPGGRVLRRETWERLKAANPKSDAPTTGGQPAEQTQAKRTIPADRHIQARLERIRGNRQATIAETEGDVRAAAAELGGTATPPEQVIDLVKATTAGMDPAVQAEMGQRLAAAASAGSPEGVKSGWRNLAEWAAGLPLKAATAAARGLLWVGKKLLFNTTAALMPPVGGLGEKLKRTAPAFAKYLGVLALNAGLFAASIAVPVLLPVALSLKLGIALGTTAAAAGWLTVGFGAKRMIRKAGQEVMTKWTGDNYMIDHMQANPIPAGNTVRSVRRFGEDDAEATAGEEIALAGKDGKRAAELMSRSMKQGKEVLGKMTEQAVARLLTDPDPLGATVLFSDDEMQQVAASLSATTAAADLLGRSRVRRLAHHAKKRAEKFNELMGYPEQGIPPAMPDEPDGFDVFAEAPDAMPANQAAEYFRGLVPELGIDPRRYAAPFDRHAFTLSVAADQSLLSRVKQVILDQIESGRRPFAVADIQDELDAAGVGGGNPQYAEMVYRTNMNDAYMQGFSREMQAPDMQQEFPAWQYLGIKDGRQGEDHEPHFDRYFPNTATFSEVRGNRVFNCRCSAAPIHRFEWDRLKQKGERTEGGW